MSEPTEPGHTGRTRRMHFRGNIVEELQALPPNQPFGESVKGWPYKKIAQDYSPGTDVTTVTLQPYGPDQYMRWLEGQRALVLERS